MAKFEAHLKCSFCGKAQDQVRKLIAGPGVYICDECIDLCNEILDEELIDNPNHQRSGNDQSRKAKTATTSAKPAPTLASIPKEPANSTRQLCEIDALRWLTAIA